MAVKSNFASGEVLTASDTNTYLTNGGLVWVAETDFGATGTPFINGCFSNKYRHYRVLVSVYGSVGGDVRMRVRHSTSTPETGAVYDRFGFTSGAAVATANAADQTSALLAAADSNSNTRMVVAIDVFNPNIANVHTNLMIQGWSATNGSLTFFNNRIQSNTEYTGLEMTCDTGNLLGNIVVYGYRMS